METCRCTVEQAPADPLTQNMRHLYLCTGLSTYQIADLTAIDRQRVTRLLRRAGVPIPARGAGRRRERRRVPDPPRLPELLAQLYARGRLSSQQIGVLLGMPERRVRERLREAGIGVRTRGRCNREDRTEIAVEALEELYVRAGMSAGSVARVLGVSRGVVLRGAHEGGLPVRTAAPDPFGEIELVNALYGDPLVRQALRAHDVRPVPPGKRLWERFPRPVRLSKELLYDLYVVCGVSSTHVELLTGQPSGTVRRQMKGHGIPLRPPGGRSPFLRRWWTQRSRVAERGP